MHKYLFICCFSFLFLAVSSFSQSQIKPEGTYPTGMCTMDYNAWGHASNCACPDTYRYERRAGLCIPELSILEEISTEGTLLTGLVAIGGETKGIELVSNDSRYELILEVKTLENIEESNGLIFEVVGDLIYLPAVERKSRPAIIVKEMNLIQ